MSNSIPSTPTSNGTGVPVVSNALVPISVNPRKDDLRPVENRIPILPAEDQDFQAQLYQATVNVSRPLGGLMTWLLDRRNIQSAWERVSGSEGADTPGPDGSTCRSIQQYQGEWLTRLADDLYHQRYQPQPPRRIEIPKPNKPGATRTLGILNVRDRVVHAALKQVFEPLLEPNFLPGSFGFRPGRSVTGALTTAARMLGSEAGSGPQFLWAMSVDVADCFPTIDHSLLLADLARHISDPDVLRLMERCLAAGGESVGRLWWTRACGLVQGSSLSPLLCNLALHPLDEALDRLGRESQDGVHSLRYADNVLLLARDGSLLKQALSCAQKTLRQRRQSLGGKQEMRPAHLGIDWLGVCLMPRRLTLPGLVEFGHVVPDAKVHAMLQRITEMTTPPSDKIDTSAFNASRWIVSINDQLRDWRQAYLYADNAPDVFRVLDEHARRRVGALLSVLTGTRGYEVQRQFRVQLARGYWTWEVPGARLSVLSMLAPHTPTNLTRKPAWMCRRKNR